MNKLILICILLQISLVLCYRDQVKSVKFLVKIFEGTERGHKTFLCNGVLIENMHVLAQHECLTYKNPKNLSISAGEELGNNRKGRYAGVRRTDFGAGIVVLKLNRDISSADKENIAPVDLYDKPLETGDTVKVIGWALSKKNGVFTKRALRAVTLNVIDKKKCQDDFWKKDIYVSDDHFCVAGVRHSPLYYNVGSAVIKDGKLCGIEDYIGDASQTDPDYAVDVTKKDVRNFVCGSVRELSKKSYCPSSKIEEFKELKSQ